MPKNLLLGDSDQPAVPANPHCRALHSTGILFDGTRRELKKIGTGIPVSRFKNAAVNSGDMYEVPLVNVRERGKGFMVYTFSVHFI
jgi:hypothetical protein